MAGHVIQQSVHGNSPLGQPRQIWVGQCVNKEILKSESNIRHGRPTADATGEPWGEASADGSRDAMQIDNLWLNKRLPTSTTNGCFVRLLNGIQFRSYR